MILKDYTCMSVLCITVWTNVACNKETFTQSCFLHVSSGLRFCKKNQTKTKNNNSDLLISKSLSTRSLKFTKLVCVSPAACLQFSVLSVAHHIAKITKTAN